MEEEEEEEGEGAGAATAAAAAAEVWLLLVLLLLLWLLWLLMLVAQEGGLTSCSGRKGGREGGRGRMVSVCYTSPPPSILPPSLPPSFQTYLGRQRDHQTQRRVSNVFILRVEGHGEGNEGEDGGGQEEGAFGGRTVFGEVLRKGREGMRKEGSEGV